MDSSKQSLNPLVSSRRHPFRFAILIIVIGISAGALGYHLIEGWGWINSLYAATQTVTTVGYGDVTPKSDAGRLFSIVFMLAGVGIVFYSLTNIVQRIVQSELLESLQRRKRARKMMKLSDHYIICGAGRVGSRVVRELERSGTPFVVIEQLAERVKPLIESGGNVIVGDATLETILEAAGVERACGLAACLPDDAANLYVVLTARGLNPALHIVARAVEEQAEPKLFRAGANDHHGRPSHGPGPVEARRGGLYGFDRGGGYEPRFRAGRGRKRFGLCRAEIARAGSPERNERRDRGHSPSGRGNDLPSEWRPDVECGRSVGRDRPAGIAGAVYRVGPRRGLAFFANILVPLRSHLVCEKMGV
jgi:voltage-gated potassium channel Kch